MSIKTIENGVLGLAQLNSPDGTPTLFLNNGIVTTSSAQSGATGSNALATTSYVTNAITQSGTFSQNTAYIWNSSFQTFGNSQLVNIGESALPVVRPQTGNTNTALGLQINNNLSSGQGESDFVNYSQGGLGGFAFSNLSSTNTWANLATLYRTNQTTCQLNLIGASSSYKINGSVVGTLTATTSTTTIAQGTVNALQSSASNYVYSTNVNAVTRNISTNFGVTTISLFGATTPNPIQLNNVYATGATQTNLLIIGTWPTTILPSMTMTWGVNVYDGTGTALPCILTVIKYSTDPLYYMGIYQTTTGASKYFTNAQTYTVSPFTISYSS